MAVAHEIVETGHAVIVSSDTEARQHMVDEWLAGHQTGQRVILVTATHEESQIISELIQASRLQAGDLDTDRPVGLQSEQAAYVGDVIQTRRNDRRADVENRQQWTIADVTAAADGTVLSVRLMSLEDSGVSRDVDGDYLAEHAHLSYAATVHGVQGETTDRALVGPGVDAAGLYVGLTRGREHNAAVVVADNARAARDQLVDIMQRGRIEATLDDVLSAARLDLAHAAHRVDVPTSEDGKLALWHERKVRPLGAMIHVDQLLIDAVDEGKSLFEQIARAERVELSRAYRKITRRITDLQRESAIRTELGPDVTAYEDDARRRAVRARRDDETPAWDDRKLRPLGKIAALRAKRVATKTELDELSTERHRRAAKIAAAQNFLRTRAGLDRVPLTPEHRARVAALLKGAQTEYDKAVARHAQMTKLLQAIDREQSMRDRLEEAGAALTERVNALRAELEVGMDAEGERLTDRTRAELRSELAQLEEQSRTADEDRARRA